VNVTEGEVLEESLEELREAIRSTRGLFYFLTEMNLSKFVIRRVALIRVTAVEVYNLLYLVLCKSV
jgi:hypothetical protein